MEQETQTPTPVKKDDDKVTKILFGVVFFGVVFGVFLLIKLMPFCRERCSEMISMTEIASLPVLICASVLVAGSMFNKVKKIPEKKVEIIHSDEVPAAVLMRMLITSYTVSTLICLIPSITYAVVMNAVCGGKGYSTCKTEVNLPFFVIFPAAAALAIYAGFKLAYRMWVPLFVAGKYPNGNPIMKRLTPRKEKMMTLGAALLGAAVMIIMTIIAVNA